MAGWKRKLYGIIVITGRFILFAVILSVVLIICFRFIPPPASMVMLQRYVTEIFKGEKRYHIQYKWVDWEKISSSVPIAMIAAEDQKFRSHWGFDLESISDAVEHNRKGGRLRGASTITQQVAKNLFLCSGRSYIRKGAEAYFTVLLELLWPKKRILEVYMNIAEFGDSTYGVYAASKIFFGKNPLKLTRREAALLAAVLPNPKQFKVNNPSRYVIKRVAWIDAQIKQLGGARHLKGL